MFHMNHCKHEKHPLLKDFDETLMNAAASWTAVTSGAIHRFRVGESECPGEFQATWLHVKSGNCEGSVAALQDLAEDLTEP